MKYPSGRKALDSHGHLSWLHVGISPKLYPAFEDANSAIEGAQGPASEIPFSSCSSSSLEFPLICMHNSCMRTVDMKLKKNSNMPWRETRHVAHHKIPGWENLITNSHYFCRIKQEEVAETTDFTAANVEPLVSRISCIISKGTREDRELLTA